MSYTKDIAVLSVSELTLSIKSVLESQYRFIHIHGEVSNLRIPYSGHIYFTLKDSHAQIRAVLFKGQQRYLAEKISEGQDIICHGRVSLYEPRGEYQIIIDTIDFKGTGILSIQYEKLKKKLADEGLFRVEIKKEIPPFPEKIILVTSPTGAAVFDFLRISSKRGYWGNTTIYPVAVQGANSASDIIKALETINASMDADLIIIMRGGGSIEDLWTFNEENVARAIHLSAIPVVTGIGHETDLTIADLCSDLQTHTPTAAAEATIPAKGPLLEKINSYRRYLVTDMMEYVNQNESHIKQLRRIIGDMDLYLSNHTLQLDYQISTLINTLHRQLSDITTNVQFFIGRLHRQAPLVRISMQRRSIEYLRQLLTQKISLLLERKQNQLGKQAALMDSVSPLSVLARGYSVVVKENKENGDREIVTYSSQVKTGDIIDVRLHRGELTCLVRHKTNDK